MQQKNHNGKERLIERLTESLENYRQVFERKLSTTYAPGDRFPEAYLSDIEHYARMFLWTPYIGTDTLVRLNASVIDEDSINSECAPQVMEFVQIIDTLSNQIVEGY